MTVRHGPVIANQPTNLIQEKGSQFLFSINLNLKWGHGGFALIAYYWIGTIVLFLDEVIEISFDTMQLQRLVLSDYHIHGLQARFSTKRVLYVTSYSDFTQIRSP